MDPNQPIRGSKRRVSENAAGNSVFRPFEEAKKSPATLLSQEMSPVVIGKSGHFPSPTLSPASQAMVAKAQAPPMSLPSPMEIDDHNTLKQMLKIHAMENYPLADVNLALPEGLDSHDQWLSTGLVQAANHFDQLPDEQKMYALIYLLRRCPTNVLQRVGNMVRGAIKQDFISHLPQEIAYHILEYLDLKSLGICAGVCKDWHSLLVGKLADHLWKRLLYARGWYNAQEVEKAKAVIPRHIFKNVYRRHHILNNNWETGRFTRVVFPAHDTRVVTCLQFDDDKIVSGSDDMTMCIFDVKTGYLRQTFHGHEGGVWALQYLDNTLVSGSTDRTVRVWDLISGKNTHTFGGHTSTVRCLILLVPKLNPETGQMEPPSPLIVSGSRDGTLRVWLLPDPQKDSEYHDLMEEVMETSITPKTNPFFQHVLTGHTNSVRAIVGHGLTVVSGSYDCSVRVWNVATGQCLHHLRGHRDRVYCVGYDHQTKRAASGSMDTTVKVWDTVTGECLHTLEGHNSLVGLLELSPSYLISAAADATLRIWDPVSGNCLGQLNGHAGAITCFQHDTIHNRIVSGSDGGVRAWEMCNDLMTSQRELRNPSRRAPPLTYGRYLRSLVTNVMGVWKVSMDERRVVCSVQRDDADNGTRTWFEVLDFGVGLDN